MSETTNLKLFKHDNPSTNQNLFDVAKSMNENWDKIDEYVFGQEAGRQENEQVRQENEKERQTQETARENQENVRKNNEETRKANELTREKNETQREENERVREEYVENLKKQVASGEVGNGIENIELIDGAHEAGKFDTYQISYTDGTTKEFQVYNGKDGTGVGDMLKATYDADNDGIVDNAKKVNNHTVESDVPANAKFSDTTYSNATTTEDGLMSLEDKKKLDGIDEGANKYIHPSSHNASIINQDNTHRFVTDTEKNKWNAKGEAEHCYRLDVSQTIADNSEITIPCKYQVGNDSLTVFLNGEKLIRATSTQDGSYKEVGSSGTISSKIQIYEWGCTADPGDVFEFIVRGVYS